MITAVALSFSAVADAQLTVRIRPTAPQRERPMAPSTRHIWISGEWNSNNNQYQYTDGYWAEPRRGRYHRRVEGHWKNTRRGYVWVPGSWRR